ncbi:hypothetical protein FQA39_LY10973 [Lamprigera yunnana]|nr:hypothetical protein FQA39_LY10973 [Lamprigera yunnana]
MCITKSAGESCCFQVLGCGSSLDDWLSVHDSIPHPDGTKRGGIRSKSRPRRVTLESDQNWEDSMDKEETEEASLTESASAIGDGGAYADIRKHTDMRENDSNENEATTESASANKKGGIGKSTDSNQKHFKTPLWGAKKSKRKAIDMDETERRMKEAYDIIKQSLNTDPPKTTLCTAYRQLVTQRLETLSKLQRTIVMHEIDNLFFRTTMGYLGHQYQSTSPGPASPAYFYSSSSDDTFHTTPSITSLLTINSLPQHSATSSGHQPPRAL